MWVLVMQEYMSFIKNMSVGLCGMSLGCINAAIQSGILQVLWECEAPRYKTTYLHTYTLANLHSCFWTRGYSV